jgi:hypothetical protein
MCSSSVVCFCSWSLMAPEKTWLLVCSIRFIASVVAKHQSSALHSMFNVASVQPTYQQQLL